MTPERRGGSANNVSVLRGDDLQRVSQLTHSPGPDAAARLLRSMRAADPMTLKLPGDVSHTDARPNLPERSEMRSHHALAEVARRELDRYRSSRADS
jgi:hypothetical protein